MRNRIWPLRDRQNELEDIEIYKLLDQIEKEKAWGPTYYEPLLGGVECARLPAGLGERIMAGPFEGWRLVAIPNRGWRIVSKNGRIRRIQALSCFP